MRKGVKEHSCDINIRFLLVPRPVVAAPKSRDENLASYLDRVVLMACLVKSVFNAIDDLVSDF